MVTEQFNAVQSPFLLYTGQSKDRKISRDMLIRISDFLTPRDRVMRQKETSCTKCYGNDILLA